MDKNALIVLTADLTTQMAVVKSVSLMLEERARGLQPDDLVRLANRRSCPTSVPVGSV